jgi:transposase
VAQTLRNWAKAAAGGKLNAPGTKVVTPEEMELSRLRAENARLKMHVENFGSLKIRVGKISVG